MRQQGGDGESGLEEAVLVRAAQETAEGMRDLYRAYLPRVYAYVAYRAGTRQDTEDIVSETFLRVAANLPRFKYRGDGSFKAWLFKIATNQVHDHQRRRRRRRPELPLEAAASLVDGEPALDDALERQQEFEDLRALVSTLPARRQKVVLLRFFGGLRNREIAKVLGLDERTVASHLSRGIQDLHRKYVSSQEPTDIGGGHEGMASVESRFAH